jgi:hypothetical protein
LVAGGWSVLREKYCWLVADKPSEQVQVVGEPARQQPLLSVYNSTGFYYEPEHREEHQN